MMVILLISSIILHFKLPKLPPDRNSDSDRVIIKYSSAMAVLMIVGLIVGWLASSEQFGIYLFASVIIVFIRQLYPIIYFMNHPKLKEYAWKTLKQWSQSKLIVNLELWKNVCLIFIYFYTMGGCFGLLFTYKWPKAKRPNNQVSPA